MTCDLPNGAPNVFRPGLLLPTSELNFVANGNCEAILLVGTLKLLVCGLVFGDDTFPKFSRLFAVGTPVFLNAPPNFPDIGLF